MKSSHDAPLWPFPTGSRAGISRRALEAATATALALGLCGGVVGLLVGALAPGIAIGLYALDGPDPPPAFSPIRFGLKLGVGLGLAWGAGLGLLFAIVMLTYPRLLRVRLRSLMVAAALCAMVLWAFMRSLK